MTDPILAVYVDEHRQMHTRFAASALDSEQWGIVLASVALQLGTAFREQYPESDCAAAIAQAFAREMAHPTSKVEVHAHNA